MKRTIVALAVAFTTCGACAPVARAIEYRLEAGLAAYRWTEHLSYGTPKEQGPILVFGGYVSGFPSIAAPALTVRGDVQVFLGRVNYDTYAQNLSNPALITPSSTHSGYVGVRYGGDVGWRFDAGRVAMEPFLGAAYRWWWRYVESDGGAQGYPEVYNTVYGRIGLRGEYALASGMALRGAASIDPLLWAQEQIDLTDFAYIDSGSLVEGQRVTVKNGLRPGWTIEMGIRQGNLDVTGYWQAVRLDESNIVTCYDSVNPAVRRRCLQPESHQDVIGLKVGFAF